MISFYYYSTIFGAGITCIRDSKIFVETNDHKNINFIIKKFLSEFSVHKLFKFLKHDDNLYFSYSYFTLKEI